MPYGRRRMTSPVKRDKHEIVWSNLSEDASAATNVLLASGVDVGAKTGATDVAVGSHIYGIYLEFHFSAAQTGNVNIINWSILFSKAGQTLVNPNLFYQDIRADIAKRGMEMLPTSVSTVFKRIIFVRVPKKFQRMSQGMQIQLRYIASSTQTINACGFAIYKELY